MSSTSSHSAGHVSHRLALPPGYEVEGCRIEAVLGKGGFGLTYLATDLALNVKVAIKELLPDGIATRLRGATVVAQTENLMSAWDWALQRFEEEARILAQLRHPNIVRVLRLIRANGTAYMVMEYVEGRSFADYLRQTPRPSEAELRGLLMPLLDGLEHVHQKRLLHRDISPENIFITHDGRPVLLDFGSARQDMGKTVSVTSVVRHGYSPFEQYQVKSHQGPYTDLYALAGVMATAMTGQKPPPATDRISDASLFAPLVTQCRGRYTETFCQAIDTAFAVLPQSRPASIPQFRQILNGTTTFVPPGGGGGGPTGPGVHPPVTRRGVPVAAWLGGGVFACAASAALVWWFAVALPERQQQTRDGTLAMEEANRTREIEHQQEIARLKKQQADAEAAAAKAEAARLEAERLARLAEQDRVREEERRLAAMKKQQEDAAEADRLARIRAEEEARRKAAEEAERLAEEQAKTQARETRVAGLRTFVSTFITSLGSDNPSDTSSLYASYSDYKYYEGSGKAPRSFVYSDRLSYIRDYPVRSYQMLNNRNFTYNFITDSTASVSFSYSYNISNSSRRRSGTSHVRLIVEWYGSSWLITSFDETVVRD